MARFTHDCTAITLAQQFEEGVRNARNQFERWGELHEQQRTLLPEPGDLV
jgi:hypothetical protein